MPSNPSKTSQPMDDAGRPVQQHDPVRRNFKTAGHGVANDLVNHSEIVHRSFPKQSDTWLSEDHQLNASGTPHPSDTSVDPDLSYPNAPSQFWDHEPDRFQATLLSGDCQPASSQHEHQLNYLQRTQRLVDPRGDGLAAQQTARVLNDAASRGVHDHRSHQEYNVARKRIAMGSALSESVNDLDNPDYAAYRLANQLMVSQPPLPPSLGGQDLRSATADSRDQMQPQRAGGRSPGSVARKPRASQDRRVGKGGKTDPQSLRSDGSKADKDFASPDVLGAAGDEQSGRREK